MQGSTLLGHLAPRMGGQTENLATEALCFALKKSPAARSSFVRFLRPCGDVLPDDLAFRTQAGSDDGVVPDLVGADDEGRQRLLVEAKFWAGLTEAQPVKYLRRLESAGGGVLLFIAPAQRLELLWGELLSRCAGSGIAFHASPSGEHFKFGATASGVRLAATSWRALLDALLAATEADADASTAADLRQLQGLCERMDTDAFLPLGSAELTDLTPRRIVQFGLLVDELGTALVAEGLAKSSGRRASGSNGWYGRPLLVEDTWCLLHFNAWQWSAWAHTPLWFRVSNQRSQRHLRLTRAVRAALQKADTPFYVSDAGTDIPLFLPIGVERDSVLRTVRVQVTRVLDLLRQSASALAVADHGED